MSKMTSSQTNVVMPVVSIAITLKHTSLITTCNEGSFSITRTILQ